ASSPSRFVECIIPKHFTHYQGHGFRVAAEWDPAKGGSFAAFLRDVGKKPSPELTLDRLNNDGPYAPGNVAWRPRREQNRNTRRNVYITVEGRRMCLWDTAKVYNMSSYTLRSRVLKRLAS